MLLRGNKFTLIWRLDLSFLFPFFCFPRFFHRKSLQSVFPMSVCVISGDRYKHYYLFLVKNKPKFSFSSIIMSLICKIIIWRKSSLFLGVMIRTCLFMMIILLKCVRLTIISGQHDMLWWSKYWEWIVNGIFIDYYDHWYVWMKKLARNNSNYDLILHISIM